MKLSRSGKPFKQVSKVRINWGQVLDEARVIVRGYDTSVTLRQLFYRLVAVGVLPNTTSRYHGLSAATSKARRNHTFPALSDRTRQVHEYKCWASPQDALVDAAAYYRLDRTEGQEVSLYIATEKATMVNQLQDWFGDLGVPILALGGYSSQTYTDDVVDHVEAQGRPAVLLYAGDHDPSGEDIDRDFVARTGCWKAVHRIALSADQVVEYDLPTAMGKSKDSRSARFIERHGELVQVELEALPPDVLRSLYRTAFEAYWDTSIYDEVIEREAQECAGLQELASRWEPEQQ